jgi:hypothetical protein
MNEIHGKVTTPLTVDGVLSLHGMASEGVRVVESGILNLHGMVAGNLVVEPGGGAEVHGMVTGDVVNRGGDVVIAGMVNGRVRDESDTETQLLPGSIVGGRRTA